MRSTPAEYANGMLTVSLYYSQDETSEMFIGEWAEKRGIRDQLVIATKVNDLFFYRKILN